MQQNLCVVEASWFSLNGLENLIALEEQRYSWKFWRNFAIVVVLGVSQIVAGAVLEIFTAGVGTYAASFLINEGISDLFFAAGYLFNGYMTMSSYWEHKKWSMAMSAATCMIGGILARGKTVSRIGYKVAGPVRTEGGKKIAQMVGKELIQNVGAKTVAKETMKRVGCKLIEGVAFGAAQGAIDHAVTNYLNGVCDAIQKMITSDLDALFQHHQLNETVSEAFKTLGEDQARLRMEQVTRECFEGQSMLQTMYTWCKRIYGVVSRGIGEAMRKIGKVDSAKAVKTALLFLKGLQFASLVEGVTTEMIKVKLSAGQFLDKATKIVQEGIDEKKPSEYVKASPPNNVRILCEQTTQNWKQIFIETSNQAIANQIVAPVLSFGANKLLSLIGDAIKKKYRSMKEEKYQKQFDSLKKDFDNKMKDEQIDSDEYEKELQAYHDTLMKVLAKTRNPILFANILRENVPMDMVCVQACTYLIHKYMSEMNIIEDGKKFTGIRIVVEGQNGSSHEYSSSSNPSHSINIELDNNHFVVDGQSDGNTETSKNNCLYKALVNKFPAMKNAFADGGIFRQNLSNYIENDKFMYHTIAQGWHKFSIQKGSFGGAINEEKFNQQSLYNQLLERTEEAKNNLIRKYPNLPDRVRQRFCQSIETIKKIAQEEGSIVEARKRIEKITEDFSKYLTKELSGDRHRDPRTDFKKALSDFGNRVNQTLTTTYTNTLQNFQSKAELAKTSKNHPFSVHPADKANFAQDDSRLKDPDIIASVVHEDINKALSEDVRRFNTVAVCIHNKTLYIAMNQIQTINGQQSYGISDERCNQIRDLLVSKNLVSGREEIVFLAPNAMPRNQAECRGPHAEMQIMKFLKDNGFLQGNQTRDQNKPIQIGASKPACVCCSTEMTTNNIHHKIYANANTNPVNWCNSTVINVKVQRRLSVPNYRK
ncbi:unnamed protein product [Rotaria socialis]